PLVYGNILGVVRKAGTSDFVVGATVSVAGRSHVTELDGGFNFANIVAETYQLTVTAPGYITYQANVSIPENGSLTHNVDLNFSQVFTPNTVFNTSVMQGHTTSITVPMSNTGTATLSYQTASGVYGGDLFPADPLYEDFEDGLMTGWSGSVGAFSDIYTGYGYNSQNVWVFAANQTTQHQYIITPKLRVGAGNNLSFWYKQFNASDETFQVLVSTTTNEFAAFTNVLATVGPLADTNWAQFNQSLAAYNGMDIYICFYYPRTDGYQYGYILIDNVSGPTTLMAPMGWLACTPLTGELAIGAQQALSLNVNATNLVPGNYTAQTWIISNGLVSPYRLYVNLTVQSFAGLDAPAIQGIERFEGGVALGWDEVDYANSYKVYVSDNPNSTNYNLLGIYGSGYAEITDVELANAGIADRAFFKVRASSDVRSMVQVLRSDSSTSSPLLERISGRTRSKALEVMK
ncbi:MAG: choice-of-anchor J domain-containing protein, partial [Candidatus Cloacimonadaceae bacterium]|nr:choice-of-anchor J domain-containing protein [Candidatus Cloacimonadaceae bacterium]